MIICNSEVAKMIQILIHEWMDMDKLQKHVKLKTQTQNGTYSMIPFVWNIQKG